MGRRQTVEQLAGLMLGGAEVLLYGPVGVGKSAVLDAVGRRASAAGRPCGIAPHTGALQDVVEALGRAYPDVTGSSRRALRSRLRLRAESAPPVLLLDHVARVPTAAKSFLRSLRGTGTGLLYAVDADRPRDHARARAMRLCHREVALSPLGRRDMRKVLARFLREAGLTLHPRDDKRLLDAAAGRPGWIRMMVELLADDRYWHGDRVRTGLLEVDVGIAVMERYMVTGRRR